jgi:hypothetical protein
MKNPPLSQITRTTRKLNEYSFRIIEIHRTVKQKMASDSRAGDARAIPVGRSPIGEKNGTDIQVGESGAGRIRSEMLPGPLAPTACTLPRVLHGRSAAPTAEETILPVAFMM